MTEAPREADQERPGENLGRFAGRMRITERDGSVREVDFETDVSAAQLRINEPPIEPDEA